MSALPRTCYLNPRIVGRSQIELAHEENVLIDGGELFPDNEQVSNLKLVAMADCNLGSVIIQVVGTVHCRHKGRVLTRGAKYLFGPGNTIELDGEFEYEVCFNPPMPDYVVQPNLPVMCEKTTIDPQYTTNNQQSTWRDFDTDKMTVYTPNMLNHSSAVAAYTLNDVLVKPNTWTLKYDNIERRLKKLYLKKYKIALFINRVIVNKATLQTFKEKIETFLNRLGIPIQVFICSSESKYKKPIPFMWHAMAENFNDNITLEPDRCYYIGSSFDLTDRLFAVNLGIKFSTSEEFFNRQPVSMPQMPAFNPKDVPDEIIFSLVVSGVQEVILMVGRPSSGKTFVYKTYLQDYHYSYVDGGGGENTVAKLQSFLQTTKRSVFIDGLNPSKAIREKYIKIANEFHVPCRCFLMEVCRAQAKHINKIRELCGAKIRSNLNVLLDKYELVYETPELKEGFSTVVVVPFVPRYENDEQKKLYRYFLIAD